MSTTIRLKEMDERLRILIDEAIQQNGLVIEDESGRACCGIVPYRAVSEEARAAAMAELEDIQLEVGDRMRERGESESGLDSVLRAEE